MPSYRSKLVVKIQWWAHMMRLSVTVTAIEMHEVLFDRGIKDSGSRPRRSRQAREELWAFTTSWSASLQVLAHNLFSWRLFRGVFICSTSCLSHLSVNPPIRDLLQNYVACLSPHFSLSFLFSFFFFKYCTCLLWHVIHSCKQLGSVAYPSRLCRMWW